MMSKPNDPLEHTASTRTFSQEEVTILRNLLFDSAWSRNQQFEQIEQPNWRRLHRMAKHLRSLHRETLRKDGHVWAEMLSAGGVCLHIHRPNVGLARRVFLSETEWMLLQELGST